MRLFQNLSEAESEIRRDIAKGTPVESSRVQQRTGLKLQGRERVSYNYSIQELGNGSDGELDTSAPALAKFGHQRGFPLYQGRVLEMAYWLDEERIARLHPYANLSGSHVTEKLNPALQTTYEGNHPSYTYLERLMGALPILVNTIRRNPDTRRAFWPIYQPQDAIRSAEPTRIPCSLGYELMLRSVGNHQELMMYYLERSCDFDNFWLSDVWLARQFQIEAAKQLDVAPGQLIHYIISFHSFQVDDQEIY